MKTMKTIISKSMRGGYQAETMTETDANGHAWQISTWKNSRGEVACSAIQGSDNGNGMFSYEMFGANRLELAKEVTKCTEAAVRRVHEAGLIAFAKVQALAPEITAPAYVLGVGQIVFTDGLETSRKRVIYEVKSPGQFKTVTLDGKELSNDDRIKPYSEKFGIGIYYNEGETLPIEQVNDLVNQARQATEERHEAERKAGEVAAKEKAAKIEKGRAIISVIPEGVQAVIMGIRFSTTYDPYADYNSHPETNEEVIYLAWSNHTRDIFTEMRKAADKYERTKHLGTGKGIYTVKEINENRTTAAEQILLTDAGEAEALCNEKNKPENRRAGNTWIVEVSEIEHREKYSMGSGYYLKGGEWKVKKGSIGRDSLENFQIAAAEGRFFCNIQEATTKEATKLETQEVKAGQVQIIDYSEKAIAVIGDTKPIKDKLKSLGGKFNFRLSCGAGWIFKKSDLEKIQKALTPENEGDTPKRLETEGQLIAAQYRRPIIPESETIEQELTPDEAQAIRDEVKVRQWVDELKEAEVIDNQEHKHPALAEEVKKTLQFFVDTDLKENGSISEGTREAVKVQEMEIEERPALLEAAKQSPNIIFCRPVPFFRENGAINELMETTHTPGEWATVKDSFDVISHDSGRNIINICQIKNAQGRPLQELNANAHLIASAPEMLETLQRLSEQARTFLQSDAFGLIKKKDFEKNAKNRLGAIIETAEKAIKKAKGE
jgi:hypothetical protein